MRLAAVGFTGTQRGMTAAQIAAVRECFKDTQAEIHHGDCVGADAQAHHLAMEANCRIVLHPPANKSKRAGCVAANIVWAEKPYIQRNHDIVDATDALIATPGETEEQLRSGTWATVRYARKRGKSVWVIYPDGSIGS